MLLVLEGLALHDVAPMARRVADREEDRLVLAACFFESFRAPGIPVHGIVGVLQQVGTLLVSKSIGVHVAKPLLPDPGGTARHASMVTAAAAAIPESQNEGMDELFRIERDTMGEVRVPADALYGAQTARALANFPIGGPRFPRSFIRALGLIKSAAARVNGRLGHLPADRAAAIEAAADEVAGGR